MRQGRQSGSFERVFRPARALWFVAFSDLPHGFASQFPTLPGARPTSPWSVSSFLLDRTLRLS
jgi:hypothetical protein